MRNTFPGVCYRCGDAVAPGAGHFELHPSVRKKWRLQHADCAIRWRGIRPPPTKIQAKAARAAAEGPL